MSVLLAFVCVSIHLKQERALVARQVAYKSWPADSAVPQEAEKFLNHERDSIAHSLSLHISRNK